MIQFTYKGIRRIIIIIIGFTVSLLGLVMLLTPGPGLAVIIAGLSILGTEVLWARTLLHRLKSETATYTKGFMGWLQKHYKPTAQPLHDAKDLPTSKSKTIK